MPIDPVKLANLLAEDATGERIPCAEYLRVDWDETHTNYYGVAAFHQLPPFNQIGHTIEPRLMPQNRKDPFHELEINPDLRTESIGVTFDDVDKDITQKFQEYSSGISCEFFLYYPSQDLTVSLWSGQLQAPNLYGWKTVKATATNGYRSRELFLPSRNHRRECTAAIFGGQLPNADAVRSSLCPYDRHVGGTVGLFKTGSTPFSGCPKTLDACEDRFGHTRFFGGFITDASAVISDPRSGWLAHSVGNASNLTESVRVIFGYAHVRGHKLLLWRRMHNAQTPEHGFVDTVWEISEGPIFSMSNFRINEIYTVHPHYDPRLGTRGQTRTSYTNDVSNFSSTAVVHGVHGWVNALDITPDGLSAECIVAGFSEVCVYTDDDPITKTRVWSDDRVWCLLELYKNQKFGFGYSEDKFNITEWMAASAWGLLSVTFTATFPDGEEIVYTSRRTALNGILEGRSAGEQIEDICRSGAISVPFEHERQFTLVPFRAATALELSNARVFTDAGEDVNIVWEKGQPAIELAQTPDNKVVNEIELRFEDLGQFGVEVPITVDDPNQKLKAGRQLGPDYFLSVPKRYTGFGINTMPEAVRMAYRLLKFGEFDEGGTDNNLRLTIRVPFEQVLGIRRYEIIKIVSQILDDFSIGYGDLEEDTVEYFRVLSMKKVSGGQCRIVAQAYNHTAYEAFEVEGSIYPPGYNIITVTEAGTQGVRGLYSYWEERGGKDAYIKTTGDLSTILWSGTEWVMGTFPNYLYSSPDDTDYPWEATTWVIETGGVLPVPVVTQGNPPRGQNEERTIDPPIYDTALGALRITIN